MDKSKNYNTLKKLALSNGAVLFGVAETKKIKSAIFLESDLIKSLPYAVSVAVKVSGKILEGIKDYPTKLYFHHYRALNQMLDQLALLMAGFIEKKGFSSLPIPASQIIDWEKQLGVVSHKEVAYLAGLGWIGRNNLLVNRAFGSQLRLATVFTDMPLVADKPSKDNCLECRFCVVSCPVNAIKDDKKDFEHKVCFEKLKDFRNKGFVDQFVCGICLKACRGKLKKS